MDIADGRPQKMPRALRLPLPAVLLQELKLLVLLPRSLLPKPQDLPKHQDMDIAVDRPRKEARALYLPPLVCQNPPALQAQSLRAALPEATLTVAVASLFVKPLLKLLRGKVSRLPLEKVQLQNLAVPVSQEVDSQQVAHQSPLAKEREHIETKNRGLTCIENDMGDENF